MHREKTVLRSLPKWDQQFREAFVRASVAYGDRDFARVLAQIPKDWKDLSEDWHYQAGTPTLKDYLEARYGKPKGF